MDGNDGSVYEFNGELYNTTGELADAIRQEYAHGDQQLAKDAMEEFGLDEGDINAA